MKKIIREFFLTNLNVRNSELIEKFNLFLKNDKIQSTIFLLNFPIYLWKQWGDLKESKTKGFPKFINISLYEIQILLQNQTIDLQKLTNIFEVLDSKFVDKNKEKILQEFFRKLIRNQIVLNDDLENRFKTLNNKEKIYFQDLEEIYQRKGKDNCKIYKTLSIEEIIDNIFAKKRISKPKVRSLSNNDLYEKIIQIKSFKKIITATTKKDIEEYLKLIKDKIKSNNSQLTENLKQLTIAYICHSAELEFEIKLRDTQIIAFFKF